jgi:hypothetical protein
VPSSYPSARTPGFPSDTNRFNIALLHVVHTELLWFYIPTQHSPMCLPIEAHSVLYEARPQSYVLYSVYLFYCSADLYFFDIWKHWKEM